MSSVLNESATAVKKSHYLTAPIPTDKMPPGVPYIVGNEAAERFSYYGMRAILFIFMTQYLNMKDAEATGYTHLFFASVYFFPLMGAIVADVFLGKYATIMSLSIVYCLGHLTLALNDSRAGLALGLTLIAIGAGGIKPCVSANVGDQFGRQNQHLLTRVYLWFYFSINFGSAISMLLIPVFLRKFGPHVAFGTPGLLMFIATWIFWLGRKKFAHVPPAGKAFVREAFNREGLKAILNLLPIYLIIAVFWSLYDQSSSRWVEQAEHMDRRLFGREWLPDQFQAINPLLILIYIPLFSFVIYPLLNKVFRLTPLRKISIGFFFTVASFLVPAWVETRIQAGLHPSIAWQMLAYTFLMASEIMVYATGLEFSYTQAPLRMKSIIMSLFLATNTAGNLFTAAVNFFIQNKDGTVKLAGANYYLFFAGLMFAASLLFILIAVLYRGRTYIQDAEVSPAQSPTG